MNTSSTLGRLRFITAILLVGLEFTNLVPFLAEWRYFGAQHSRYPFQYAAYGVCVLILLFDRSVAMSVRRKPLMFWLFATLLLLTWAMVVRTFDVTAGVSDYLVFREFGVRINSLGFLLTCVVIFDQPDILWAVKRTIVVATLVAVPLIVYDALQPGLFSDIPGRGAGLYMQPNSAGMALVFGCLVGLTAIDRRVVRELFVVCVFGGVLATFSREAMLAFILLIVAASIAHSLTLSRLVFVVGILVAAALMLGIRSGSNGRVSPQP